MCSFLELAADSFTQFLTGKESRFRGNMLFFPFMGDKLMPPNVEITARPVRRSHRLWRRRNGDNFEPVEME
jgi:hypothetical protein